MLHLHRLLRNSRALIDLASVMVGVIVIGIVTSATAVSLFAAVPWAQNQSARTTLNTLVVSESAVYADRDKYEPLTTLISEKRVDTTKGASVLTDQTNSCYVAAVKSGTGDLFYTTNINKAVKTVKAGDALPDTTGCRDFNHVVAEANGQTVPSIVAPLTTAQKIAEAQTKYKTAHGTYTTSLAALEADYGKPVLSSGEAAKMMTTSEADYQNKAADGSFETETTGTSRFPTVTNVVLTRMTSADAPDGGSYIRATQKAAAALQNKALILDGVTASPLHTIPVTPNKRYTITVKARPSIATSIDVKVDFYTAAGVKVGATYVAGTTRAQTAGVWASLGGYLTNDAPATAATMRVSIIMLGWGATDAYLDLDSAQVTVGYHADVIGAATAYYFPFFQERSGGYLAVVRRADKSVGYVTSEEPAGAEWLAASADVWGAVSGSSVSVSGTTVFPPNTAIPAWAGKVGFGMADPIDTPAWTNLRNQAWTIR